VAATSRAEPVRTADGELDAPMFYQPEPAARAWDITREFLARTLPV
jgi:hypothetical protein